MKILVTGAAGFIGFHTARALLERGDEVIGLDNLNAYYDVTLKEARLAQLTPHDSFHFAKANLQDRAAMEKLFFEQKPQRVIHLAAQAGVRYSLTHPHEYINSNIVGFLHILEGCGTTASSIWSLLRRARYTARIRSCHSALVVGKTAVKRMLPIRPGDVSSTFADIEELKADTLMPIEESVKRFVAWYRDYYCR
jgi:dTDP-D-glucose 4,6-dehydratase